MPAIIAPAHYDAWLDARVTENDEIMQYLNSAPSSLLKPYPVSTWVNSPKHEDERCIQVVLRACTHNLNSLPYELLFYMRAIFVTVVMGVWMAKLIL